MIVLISALLLSTGGCRKKSPDPATSKTDAVPSATIDNAQKHYQAGRKLAMQGKFDAAVEQFNKAVELNPKYFQAYDKLGMLYYSKGQHDNAVEPLEKALSLNPAVADEQANPGDIAIAAQNCAMLFDIGQSRTAFEHLTTLSKLHPDAPTVKTVMLFCKLAEEEKSSDELLFQNMSATDLDECEKKLLLAKGYVFLGNAESAMAYYDKVVSACSARPEGLTQAAYYFAMARKPEKAINICEQGLKNDPSYYPLRYVLTSVYGALEMPDEAIAIANDGVLASPHDVRCYYLLTNRYLKAGRYAAAAGVFEAMLSYVEKDPDYFTQPSQSESSDALREIENTEEGIEDTFKPEGVYANLALCHNHMQDHEKAVMYSHKALEANQEWAPAYLNLSAAYQGLKQYDKAMEVINKGIELSPSSTMLYLEKAGLYHLMDQPEKAIEPLKTALEKNPGSAMAFQGLAQTYGKLGRYEDALPYFEKAVQNTPDMLNVGNVVACYVKLNQKQKALAAFKKYTGKSSNAFVAICSKDGQRALGDQRYQDAAASFETALYADPKCTDALYGLGCVFVETDQPEKAAEMATLLEQLDIELFDKLTRQINSGKR